MYSHFEIRFGRKHLGEAEFLSRHIPVLDIGGSIAQHLGAAALGHRAISHLCLSSRSHAVEHVPPIYPHNSICSIERSWLAASAWCDDESSWLDIQSTVNKLNIIWRVSLVVVAIRFKIDQFLIPNQFIIIKYEEHFMPVQKHDKVWEDCSLCIFGSDSFHWRKLKFVINSGYPIIYVIFGQLSSKRWLFCLFAIFSKAMDKSQQTIWARIRVSK